MNRSGFASLALLLTTLSSLAHVSAEVEPVLGFIQAFSPKKYTLGESQAVNIPDVNSTKSRRLLAELLSNTVNIEAGQVYQVYFTGYSCVKFSVTSSPEDLHVMLMAENNYQTFKANSYSGAYLYVAGSQCQQTFSCEKTINGLSTSETYYLVVINDYDGVFGGEDARTEVLVETCTSPSASPSSSGSPSTSPSSSGSPSTSPSTSDASTSFTSYLFRTIASVTLAVGFLR
jgi:hypothetical protein